MCVNWKKTSKKTAYTDFFPNDKPASLTGSLSDCSQIAIESDLEQEKSKKKSST